MWQLPNLVVKNCHSVLLIMPFSCASMASSLSLHQYFINCLSPTPTPTLCFAKCPHHISILPSFRKNFLKFDSRSTVPFAVTESDSPKSLESEPQILLQEVADTFALPADFFSQFPQDLRLDLNDAAFDLSNGPVKDECGEDVGETLLNISRAWELADTSTSTALVDKLPLLVGSLTGSQKSAFGRRLLSAGKRFQSMGQYGEGEVQKIAKVMMKTGKLLSASPVSGVDGEELKQQTRTFKFGDLQVALTPGKAYTGAAIAFIFSFLSWELSRGVESIQGSSLQYANDNALLLAKSLRGSLLVMSYSSTIFSAFAMVGLILLAGQLKSEDK
ncbi:uncharacterized protein LOC129903296 [Solanum dulcamara]|uniref:uncharacterized protein LOC129903296 n=1 Tax=Solanum dulcamara TaxID=45834 RepID=UPI0024857C10|nr:uncharacterized protein LOC129903296 [Solanum dulcamara]XP_055834796.1 uncharacterized protein LOC129903296 [Solanum dulcamara]XP_055834803.1 uncharacterized protein LOC129903296 [Solanum dulcamara]